MGNRGQLTFCVSVLRKLEATVERGVFGIDSFDLLFFVGAKVLFIGATELRDAFEKLKNRVNFRIFISNQKGLALPNTITFVRRTV